VHKRRITSEAIVAYSQCPQKAFFLLCTDEQGMLHEYLRILEQQQELNRMNYIRVLQQSPPEEPSLIVSDLTHEGDLVLKATLKTEDVQA